ncbi:undecaprenyl-diphosphate phosphatase [Acinetobacter rathckeae]|uniref:undecaprenyl-diphosphate phosphatase n=1 Tax=Acinetobacter rathckeae TaxID=2605272 RepID=UPI0018A2F228|nr:undecaprenyl-diphosphate phosphatase [Acinetobacter rathckeae]MBF7686692.1 undecaprenyl-diphosphate phosphatase [Acinetobacter rathckeae]MBF7696509.1 undecaprenyl-diphosphate phosphatase [Acinetobacter rathckeae]
MTLLHVFILAVIQGFAELLPVSSSAHVIMAEKLLELDPSAPEMTFLLVMLHTGTMFAVILYFWKSWRQSYFSSVQDFKQHAKYIVIATAVTGVLGLLLQFIIKHTFFAHDSAFEIEQLFSNSKLIACALCAAGVVIWLSSYLDRGDNQPMTTKRASIIGAVQALCLPFRGFSRSGATISASLFLGISREKAEQFSFALAVVLTPVIIVKELLRLMHSPLATQGIQHIILPSLLGMVLSFIAGMLALKWLSSWLEHGKWHIFGLYCIGFSIVIFTLA